VAVGAPLSSDATRSPLSKTVSCVAGTFIRFCLYASAAVDFHLRPPFPGERKSFSLLHIISALFQRYALLIENKIIVSYLRIIPRVIKYN
jgi:hypothetical protein